MPSAWVICRNDKPPSLLPASLNQQANPRETSPDHNDLSLDHPLPQEPPSWGPVYLSSLIWLHSIQHLVLSCAILKCIFCANTYFPTRLQTPWRQGPCLVLLSYPQQCISQGQLPRTEIIWETVNWRPWHHVKEAIWKESHLVSRQRSGWLGLSQRPRRPRDIPESQLMHFL